MNNPPFDESTVVPSRIKVVITVLSGPCRGRSLDFSSHQTLTIGRSQKAHLSVSDDPRCSRFHARFEVNPPQCVVVDLQSRNGTLVNGIAIQEMTELHDGDLVQIGKTCLQVEIQGGTSESDDSHDEIANVDPQAVPVKAIPGFRLTRFLGQGGMGTVYHAIREIDGENVAVKVLRPRTTIGNGLQHFIREASILAQLKHRRIVRLFEFGLQRNEPYLVMEWVETVDFWPILEESKFSTRVRIAAGMICRVLDALEYAHANGVVHRDVKPSNILAYKDGKKFRVKLADFGLAKKFMDAGLSAMSTSDEVKGTVSYMPPEQVRDCRYATSRLRRLFSGSNPVPYPIGAKAL